MDYRREIDGLRALALLPVILFHAGFQAFSGGFVGVDVFFVISGYLITSILVTENQAGTFALLKFYERRARRILPALFMVMLVCLPFAWYLMPASDRKGFSESLVAVSTFVSNIYFSKQSGYFDTASELKPLLHTWSLAVEEQYYLLFPIFLLVTWKFGKRWIVVLLAVTAIISLAAAQWGSLNKPTFTFFMLPTRGWELLVGGFIAFHLCGKEGNKSMTGSVSELLSLTGLFLIAYAVCAFDKRTPFPGAYTLIPTMGATLIIMFANQQTLVGKVLSSKVFVILGLISYSAYLWHYPLFAFARLESLGEPSQILLSALIVATLFLAYLSWKLVETPFRNRQRIERHQVFLCAGLCTVAFVTAGSVGHFYKGLESRYDLPNALSSSFGMSLRTEECFDKLSVHSRPDWFCDLGEKSGTISFVVFGDSHAVALLEAFDTAAKSANVYGIFVGANSCAPFLQVYPLREQRMRDCNLLNRRVLDYVESNKIEKVFLVARWTYYTDGGYDGKDFVFLGLNKDAKQDKASSRKAFEVGLRNTVDAYAKIGVKLYVVTQAPQQTYDPKRIYYKSYPPRTSKAEFNANLRNLSVSVQAHHQLQSYVTALFHSYEKAKKLQIVSFDNIFCDNDKCSVGDFEKSYYHDDDHLSTVGSLLIVDEILNLLEKAKVSITAQDSDPG